MATTPGNSTSVVLGTTLKSEQRALPTTNFVFYQQCDDYMIFVPLGAVPVSLSHSLYTLWLRFQASCRHGLWR